jgi:hypothetical protein
MNKMDRRRRLKDLHHRVNKMDLHHRVNKIDLHPPIRKYMGLLSKYVKESVNKVTKGQYDGNFGEGNSTQHAKSYVLLKFASHPPFFGLNNSR